MTPRIKRLKTDCALGLRPELSLTAQQLRYSHLPASAIAQHRSTREDPAILIPQARLSAMNISDPGSQLGVLRTVLRGRGKPRPRVDEASSHITIASSPFPEGPLEAEGLDAITIDMFRRNLHVPMYICLYDGGSLPTTARATARPPLTKRVARGQSRRFVNGSRHLLVVAGNSRRLGG
ncbi:hypothetical protein BD626DRAFT_535174 [Schizophyllum amplum]|uniref:Uncharacterized protein n=1 Tax=Schizophyllum amplum TaxID=97359 RepID=A0A550CR16_9AGAR|nr:hypothetical protein BD626DRAFT_535174 [Auriculariopsis ampla]